MINVLVTMKKNKNIPLTITVSLEAYRKLGELCPNQKQTNTIRTILEAVTHFKGNYFQLLASISEWKENK